MKISGGRIRGGIGPKDALLGSVAALFAVVGAGTGADAADAAIKKAPPVQYVKVCDLYGAGFWQMPGTPFCVAFRGQLQIDTNIVPSKDYAFVSQDTKKNGFYNVNVVPTGSQDLNGWQVQAKPILDIRTQTDWGTLRTVVNPRFTFNLGIFQGNGGPGGEANKTPDCYRCYIQWTGFTIGIQGSYFEYLKQEDIQTFTVGEQETSLLFAYTYDWTKMTPGTPNPKGFAPFPDGLSTTVSFEDPNKHAAKGQVGNTFAGLAGVAVPGVAQGNVDPIPGPFKAPDVIGAVRYEADAPGTLSWQVSAILHQISMTANVGANGAGFAPIIPSCVGGGGASCSVIGPSAAATGWAALAGARYNLAMLPGTNRGALTLGNYVWLQANYGDGSIESVGIGGSQGNFSFGDNPGEQVGGLARDDHDAIAINNGAGGITLEKEKAVSFNGILHVIWTDCTDPVKCFRSNFITNYAKVMPGTITSHTDWANGGLANATRTGLGANLIWGSSRWQGEVSLEVMYFQLKQDFPCNNAGNAALPCGAPTALPNGISKDSSNVSYRLTFTKSY